MPDDGATSGRDPQLYESISTTYRATRVEDPRIAAQIHDALGDGRRVVNVGAGTGNYEPAGRAVVAVEPSGEMISKRPVGHAPVVRATAERLPFAATTFDVAMASLTLHHWTNREAGLTEMRRVARRQVLFVFDPAAVYEVWPFAYWPSAAALPSEQDLPSPDDIGEILDVVEVRTVDVPIDCTDGFGAAFWGRPEGYLDPAVQQGTSWLAQLSPEDLADGAARLAADLRSGEWDRRHGRLRQLTHLDVGYRIVVAESEPTHG